MFNNIINFDYILKILNINFIFKIILLLLTKHLGVNNVNLNTIKKMTQTYYFSLNIKFLLAISIYTNY